MKIVVAITGASGSIYSKLLIESLKSLKDQIENVSLVFSDNALAIWDDELDNHELNAIPFKVYNKTDFSAPFASGSSKWDAMIVCPCSMGVMGRIAHGISNDLITRAADVFLKERRRLILVVRETPYNLIHIENMRLITLAGGIICPATPSFYSKPKSVKAVAQTVVDRILDLCNLNIETFRWKNK